jgi:hypothetical protein
MAGRAVSAPVEKMELPLHRNHAINALTVGVVCPTVVSKSKFACDHRSEHFAQLVEKVQKSAMS